MAIAAGMAPVRPAFAQQYDEILYAACYVYYVGKPSSLYLPLFRLTRQEVWNYFEAKAEKSVLPNRQPGQLLSCKFADTPEAADADRVKTGYFKAGELPWPKEMTPSATPPVAPKPAPEPAAPKPAPKAAPPAPSLTVKTDTSLRDAARAWDEQVKKTLAAEAQKKVEAAAKAAQADAKKQAEIAAFFAERRRQGRAQ